jgi:6-pyruvoyltetrahydropterin/6-carboxytetrahydropterin synthase
MDIFKEFTFEAAHRLPYVDAGHKCGRLHGHTYRVEVHVAGQPGAESGWIVDFAAIKGAFEPVHDALDHRYLNEIEGLSNPTTENVCRWIWQRLYVELPGLSKIVVRETCTTGCSYSGELD